MLTFQQHYHNTRVYVTKSDLRSARISFGHASMLAEFPVEFSSLLQLTSALWRGVDLIKARLNLLKLIEEIEGGSEASFYLLICQINLAINDLPGFVSHARRWIACGPDNARVGIIASVLKNIESANFPDPNMEKVFVIGMSRTGTTSIHKALEILGYNAAHFFNPITRSVLEDRDYFLFDAFSDTPVCVSFERLYHRFPNSKFILTKRNMTGWLESIQNHMISIRGTDDLSRLRKSSSYCDPGNKPMYGDFDQELYFQHNSFSAAFESFNQRVEDFFAGAKRERFLALDLSDGSSWEALCRFLEKDIPNVAFPWANARSK